MTFKT